MLFCFKKQLLRVYYLSLKRKLSSKKMHSFYLKLGIQIQVNSIENYEHILSYLKGDIN